MTKNALKVAFRKNKQKELLANQCFGERQKNMTEIAYKAVFWKFE